MEQKKDDKLKLIGLEEDDEFEEFPNMDWNNTEENDTGLYWEDNWDDDDIEDDFVNQLRVELEKTSKENK